MRPIAELPTCFRTGHRRALTWSVRPIDVGACWGMPHMTTFGLWHPPPHAQVVRGQHSIAANPSQTHTYTHTHARARARTHAHTFVPTSAAAAVASHRQHIIDNVDAARLGHRHDTTRHDTWTYTCDNVSSKEGKKIHFKTTGPPEPTPSHLYTNTIIDPAG